MIMPLELDWEYEFRRISIFLKNLLKESGAKGVVIGLSGGLDSSVVATLLARSLGSDNVLGLIMPTAFTPYEDIKDAKYVAEMLRLKTIEVSIDEIVSSFIRSTGLKEEDHKMAVANLRARVRMCILYMYANSYNYLVAGTSDKSEYILGFFTKYGDGASDFTVITHLYKSQIRRFARWLGLPEHIAEKPSAPRLYPGHTALDELPADYSVLDQIMYALFDLRMSVRDVIEKLGYPKTLVDDVIRRYHMNKHKRRIPPMPVEVILQDPLE